MSRRGGAWAFTVVLAFGLVAPIAVAKRAGASPGDIYVTTTVDELNTGGACSLREAIRSANLDQAIGGCPAGKGNGITDTIILPAGTFRLTRVGAQEQQAALGDLDVTQPVNIIGAGSDKTIIDGNATDRVLDVFSPVMVFVQYLAIQNGKPAAGQPGGGVEVVAGANLYLDHTVVRNNQTADGPARTPDGGGIYNAGTAVVGNSTVSNNLAGGNEGSGGGIWNSGTMNVGGTFVRNNTANGSNAAMFLIDGGGGIFNRGTLTVQFDAVTDNVSKYRGGGIANSGRVDVTKSLFSGNTAVVGGGLFTNGTMPVTNTTISGNSATVHGGGLWSSSTTTLSNITLTLNVADSDNNGSGDGGGVYVFAGKTTTKNSLYDSNTDKGGQAPGCSVAGGSYTSQGYNHFGGTTGCVITGLGATDQVGGNAMLGPLQNNGGFTFTRALLPGSPAIDAGNPAAPGSGGFSCGTFDQRNSARPQDGNGDAISRCDIGAFELKP